MTPIIPGTAGIAPPAGDSMNRFRLLALLLVLAFPSPPLRAENWPQFRGPTGLGYTAERDLPVEWGGPDGKNVLWKSPLAGEGHASPIVWGDRVFITTALWPKDTADRKKVIPEHHVLAYRASDGKALWDTKVPPGPWLRDDFRSGPGGGYAAPTPCTDGERIFVLFGSSVAAALDLDGKVLWRKEIVPHTFDVTVGSSPVLHGDTVIILCAMAKKEDSRIVALDRATGSPRWETRLPKTGFGHATPVIIDVSGKPQMVIVASGMSTTPEAIQSFDPSNGRRIWWCEGAGDASSPAFGAGVLYADSGRGSPGWGIDPTGAGDVTRTHVRWKVAQVPEGIGSPIIVGERVYRLHSPAILKCWKAASGEEAWAKRLEGIGTTWASPIADPAGRIWFASSGKSFVIETGPEPKVLAAGDLGDPNHASPAASGGRLFLAGVKAIYCVGRE
jgi:outer membrane protein assembly factor BamB